MKRRTTFLIGGVLGAASWGLSHALSAQFEPFDSAIGFLTTQLILVPVSLVLGYKTGMLSSLVFVAGGYLGLNGYAYAFGGPEQRAWALLGAISTLVLVLIPAMAGALGSIARLMVARMRDVRRTKP